MAFIPEAGGNYIDERLGCEAIAVKKPSKVEDLADIPIILIK
jgi:hypothetical protein